MGKTDGLLATDSY